MPSGTRIGTRSVGAFVVPLAAFALSRVLVWLAAVSTGISFPGQRALVRHDSILYLSIAHRGFTLYRCARRGGWCGNSGWMPGYSVLLSPVDHAGWSAAAAGVVLSAAFQFGSLAVLWIGFFDGVRSARNLAALGTAAVFPGAIYYAAVFPLSLLTFVTLLAILAALRGRTVLAAVAVAIAAATYPIGIVVAVALAVWQVAAPGTMRQRFRRSGLIVAAGVASLVAVSGSQRLMTGRWDGYFLIQRHYGHTGTSPFSVLRMAKEQALSFAHDPHRLSLVPALQLLLVATFVIGVVATFLLTRRRDDFPAVLVVVSAWLMPLALGGVSLYRSDAVLLPGVLVTRRLPVALQLAFAVVAGLIMFEMTRQFFEGVLA